MSIEQIATGIETLDTTSRRLPLNIQLFAADGDDAGGGEGDNNGNTAGNDDKGQGGDDKALSTEALDKLIQSRVDKLTADMGKKNATLQKELDKLKKEKLTDEEVKNIEIADKEKALTEKEQALLERENRLYAIKAIKAAELDDGSDKSLALIDFVMDKDETGIDTKVAAFKNLVDRFVTAKVEQTFKANGRVPNGGAKGGDTDDKKDTNNIAKKLGEQAAERNKTSNDVLKYYYGGNS